MPRMQMSLLFGGVVAVAVGGVGGWSMISGTKPIPASVYSAMTEPTSPRTSAGPSGDAEMTTPKPDPTKVAALEPAPSAAPAAPESPATPARTAEAPPSAPAAAPPQAPAPAPAAAPAPTDAAPADDTKGKPRIRLDSERGEVSLDTEKGGISLGKERVSLRTPFGKIDFDW